MGISLNTKLVQNPEILASNIDGEKVMMSVENSEYYGLGNTASFIWDILENEVTVEEVVNEILISFEINRDQCIKDIIPFLEELIKKGLIRIVTS